MKTYRPKMQCNNKTLDYVKCSISTSGHNSCPQPKSPPINRLINDRLSVKQTSETWPQLISMSHRMLTDLLL